MKPYGIHKKVRYPGKTDCHPSIWQKEIET